MLLWHKAFRDLGKRRAGALSFQSRPLGAQPFRLADDARPANSPLTTGLARKPEFATGVLAKGMLASRVCRRRFAQIGVTLEARPLGFAPPTNPGREPLDGELQGVLIKPFPPRGGGLGGGE